MHAYTHTHTDKTNVSDVVSVCVYMWEYRFLMFDECMCRLPGHRCFGAVFLVQTTSSALQVRHIHAWIHIYIHTSYASLLLSIASKKYTYTNTCIYSYSHTYSMLRIHSCIKNIAS